MNNYRPDLSMQRIVTLAALLMALALLSGVVAAQLDSGQRQFATIERVNMSTQLAQSANGQFPSINANGRYVVFWSDDNRLIPNDNNRTGDIFLRDRQLGETVRVSIGNGNVESNDLTFPENDISDDGTLIVYASNATNLVQGDTNGHTDVFVFNRSQGAVTRASVTFDNQQANGPSFRPVISGNGRFVAFRSQATNIVPNDSNGQADIFLFDRVAAPGSQLSRINVSSAGVQSNAEDIADRFAISADGNRIVFASRATNLVPGDTNGFTDIFLRDRTTNTTRRINIGLNGAQANGNSSNPTISSNGRYIAFRSEASNLVPGDTNNRADIFLYDINDSTMTRVSVARDGAQGNDSSDWPSLNNNGRFISFWSAASNLVPGDVNNTGDIFVHDRVTGVTTRVNIALNGAQANGQTALIHSISGDAAFIAFESNANNLVANDTNNSNDIFVARGGPNNPTQLTISDVTSSSVKLTWQDNANNETRYEIERRRGNGLFQVIATLPANTIAFTDTNLRACTNYTYWVFAANVVARAGSEVVSVRTKGCPPGEFALRGALDRLVINRATFNRLRWEVSSEATSYRLQINRVQGQNPGEVLNQVMNAENICAGNFCDFLVTDGLRGQLTNGSYTWQVTAINTVGQTAARNNPGRIRVDDTLPPRNFALLTPASGVLLRSGTRVNITWESNLDAVGYDFRLVKISNNADSRLGMVLSLNNLTPAQDADALTCNEETCALTLPTVIQNGLNTGLYSWTAIARSPSQAQREARNGAYLFRINTGDINFLVNGSFEQYNAQTFLPGGWNVQRVVNDRIRCNGLRPNGQPRLFSHSGACAFQFVGAAGRNALLSQDVDTEGLLLKDDRLTLQGYVEGRNHAGVGQIIMRVVYQNGALTPDVVTYNFPQGRYDYQPFSTHVIIDGPVKEVRVLVRYRGTGGSLLLDTLSVVLEQGDTLGYTIGEDDPDPSLIPLPDIPADLRDN